MHTRIFSYVCLWLFQRKGFFPAKYHILLKTPNPNMGKMVDLLSMRVCFRFPVCRKFDSLIVD